MLYFVFISLSFTQTNANTNADAQPQIFFVCPLNVFWTRENPFKAFFEAERFFTWTTIFIFKKDSSYLKLTFHFCLVEPNNIEHILGKFFFIFGWRWYNGSWHIYKMIPMSPLVNHFEAICPISSPIGSEALRVHLLLSTDLCSQFYKWYTIVNKDFTFVVIKKLLILRFRDFSAIDWP